MEDLAEGDQLDVGDEALTGLNPLDGVFVHVQADQLEAVGQLPLGNFQFFPEGGYVCAAEVVSVIGRLIDEHNSPPFDIECLSTRGLYGIIKANMTFSECQ